VRPTFRAALIALATTAAALALLASPAFGAITTSNITSPANGAVLTHDKSAPHNITVAGTSNGTTGDTVRIVCYFGDEVSEVVSSLAVDAGGAFTSNVSSAEFYGKGLLQPCVLRAVPEPAASDPPPSEPPGTTSPFTGPTITLEAFEDDRVITGPNAGALSDYYLQDVQSQGAFDYVSAGSCGLYDSYLWDPVTFAAADPLFYCNDGLNKSDGELPPVLPGNSPATGSELHVDGVNAFLPGAIPIGDGFGTGLDMSMSPGFPPLSWTHSYDPTTQAVTITESEQPVKCAPNASVYPPTPASCPSLVLLPVKLDRTIIQSHEGRLSTYRTRWTSTDGASHQLGLELENDQNTKVGTAHIAYLFPWISPNFAVDNIGTLAGPPNGPGRIYVTSDLGAPDGGTTTPRGVIVFAGPPKSERVTYDQSDNNTGSGFVMNYDATVPPSGAASFGFAYGDAFSQAEVTALGDAAQAAFTPSVSMNAPPHSIFAKKVNVSGTASYGEGLAGVSVNGTPATVAPDGSWKATVPLKGGHNSLTAVATTIYNGTAQTAAADVVYAKLGLVGKPKAKGRFVVFRAHCGADPGASCPGNALLALKEKLRGKSVVGLTAKKRKVHTKRISAGHKRFRVKGGKTATIKVGLNKRSLKLLTHFRKLPVRVTVSVAAGGVKDRVGGSKVVFRLKKKPPHA
jgi:hypothetical protein